MSVELKKRKFSSEAYHLMVQKGILNEDDKVELLDGEVIEMSPVNNPHIGTINRITYSFSAKLLGKAIISVQNPVSISEYSEPEPDITVCQYTAHFYAESKATPEDIILLIEVSDSSLDKDRKIKLPLYADAGIKVYWIVNLAENQIEVYSNPKGKRYQKAKIYTKKDLVEIPEFNIKVPVTEILG